MDIGVFVLLNRVPQPACEGSLADLKPPAHGEAKEFTNTKGRCFSLYYQFRAFTLLEMFSSTDQNKQVYIHSVAPAVL